MKKILGFSVIAAFLVIGAGCSKTTTTTNTNITTNTTVSNTNRTNTLVTNQNSNTNSTANTNSGTNTNSAPVASTASVTIQSLAFSPATLTIKKGTTVTWTNASGSLHTIIGDDGLDGSLTNGGTYKHTFATAGTFSYHCSLHPSMTATVTVSE